MVFLIVFSICMFLFFCWSFVFLYNSYVDVSIDMNWYFCVVGDGLGGGDFLVTVLDNSLTEIEVRPPSY